MINRENKKMSFAYIFNKVIQRYSSKHFIKVYDEKNGIITKTFYEFASDVFAVNSYLSKKLEPETVLITVAGNSYMHLVYIVASSLGGWSFCPLNPKDPTSKLIKKISFFKKKCSIWTDSPVVQREIKSCNLFSIKKKVGKPQFRSHAKNRSMAYIYTSGSTGESKVVCLSEENIMHNVFALIDHHKIGPKQTIATPLPIYHVNALFFAFFSSLLSGAQLVLYPGFNTHIIKKSLINDSITIFSLTPTIAHLISLRNKDFSKKDFKTIKYFVSAAAPLSVDIVKYFSSQLKKPIIQGYGLSEAVNFSVTLPIDLSEKEYKYWMTMHKYPSVGCPLKNVDIAVLSTKKKHEKMGVVGEIGVKGPHLMKGYLGEAFIKNGDYFLTGDLGYFLKNKKNKKYFFITGRKKDVIKKFDETLSLREVDELSRQFLKKEEDVISVGFKNKYSGENFAIIFKGKFCEQNKKRISNFFKKNKSDFYTPLVCLFTSKELRTPSGKPQRWKYSSFFDKYKNEFLSGKIIFLKE